MHIDNLAVLIPDQETAVDFLNYEPVAKTVAGLLKQNRERPLTIGIHGDWGAGKSSILKMIESAVADDDKVACLWFNGWAFQGFDDAKTVLIEVIITQLMERKTATTKVKERARKLLKRLNWMKITRWGLTAAAGAQLGLPPHLAVAGAGYVEEILGKAKSLSGDEIGDKLESAAGVLKPAEKDELPTHSHDFREEFAKLLEESKIDQLVVLIDDLDRCLPETAIATLEAIRLFLFVPHSAFVIGADETMIEYAVRQHFPGLPVSTGPLSYVRNYLEKLIQVPFRVPALGIEESKMYVTLLLAQAVVGESHVRFLDLLAEARLKLRQPWLRTTLSLVDIVALDPEHEDQLKATFVLAQQIGPILAEGTRGNPRQIKRFLNTLSIRLAIAHNRGFGAAVKSSILGKLMLAERFQPTFYDQLASEAMTSPKGHSAQVQRLESGSESGQKPADEVGSRRAKRTPAGDEPDAFEEKGPAGEWLTRWARIEPSLRDQDLRPYIFVARDKRTLAINAETSGLDSLVERLAAGRLAARAVEKDVQSLNSTDARAVFDGLRERLFTGDLTEAPAAFDGAKLLAKHHKELQVELLGLIGAIPTEQLGVWATRGWTEFLTDPAAVAKLRSLREEWSRQDGNKPLQTAAKQALTAEGRTKN